MIVHIILVLLIIGVILGLINAYAAALKMSGSVLKALNILVPILLVIWAIQYSNLLSNVSLP